MRITRGGSKVYPKLVFVIGGAASGKSGFAEGLVQKSAKSKVYLASAQAFDDEMRDRITVHTARRDSSWTTIEAPFQAAESLLHLQESQICLFDCVTLWLSNHLLAENDLEAEQAKLLDALDQCSAQVVIVTNEVGHGIVPDTALGRRFRETQGRLNIKLADRADLAVHVVAGLPMVLKGTLP